MTNQKPTIVLVHAGPSPSPRPGTASSPGCRSTESAQSRPPTLYRSLWGDAAYVRDVIASVDGPVVLVGHSYAGMIITQAAADSSNVVGLVYVNAFVPETGQSAFDLSTSAPGSTLGDTLAAYPVATGGNEFVIRPELFHDQFAADVP